MEITLRAVSPGLRDHGVYLRQNKVPHRLRLLALPETADELVSSYLQLRELGFDRVALSPALGVAWPPDRAQALLRAARTLSDRGEDILAGGFEPRLCAPGISVGPDGALYRGYAAEIGESLRPLQQALEIATLDAGELDGLWPQAKDLHLQILAAAGHMPEAERVFEALDLGHALAAIAGRPALSLRDRPAAAVAEIQLTHRCQLSCTYCELDRERPDIELAMLDRAIDFACSTQQPEVRIQFFGGEPFLRFDLIEHGARRAAQRCEEAGKQLQLYVATNGLILDDGKLALLQRYAVAVIYSLDGLRQSHTRNRPLLRQGSDRSLRHESGRSDRSDGAYDVILAHLARMRSADLELFVNLVVTPENLDTLFDDASLVIDDLGIDALRLSYQLGHVWSADERRRFFAQAARVIERIATLELQTGRRIELHNFEADDEPTVAATSLNVDTDGAIYMGCTLAIVRTLPSFLKLNRLGSIDELGSIDALDTRIDTQLYKLALSRQMSSEEKRIVLNNAAFGVESKRFFAAHQRAARTHARTPSYPP